MALYNPNQPTDWRKTLKQTMQPPQTRTGALSTGGAMAGLGTSAQSPGSASTGNVNWGLGQPATGGTPGGIFGGGSSGGPGAGIGQGGMSGQQQGGAGVVDWEGAGYDQAGPYGAGGGGYAPGFEPGGNTAALSQQMVSQYRDKFVKGWAGNSIIDPEQGDSMNQYDGFAQMVAFQRRAEMMGYPIGSYGQIRNNTNGQLYWVSPDGIGPNGEPGGYTRPLGDPLANNEMFGVPDLQLDAAQFGEAHADWVEAYAKSPESLQRDLNDPTAPIWQHTYPGILLEAIAATGADISGLGPAYDGTNPAAIGNGPGANGGLGNGAGNIGTPSGPGGKPVRIADTAGASKHGQGLHGKGKGGQWVDQGDGTEVWVDGGGGKNNKNGNGNKNVGSTPPAASGNAHGPAPAPTQVVQTYGNGGGGGGGGGKGDHKDSGPGGGRDNGKGGGKNDKDDKKK